MLTTGNLSVHQLGAQRTLVMIKKILLSRKPDYIASRLHLNPRAGHAILPMAASLNLTRSSFIYRGIKLFNLLPESIQRLEKIGSFKSQSKAWVTENIAVKP